MSVYRQGPAAERIDDLEARLAPRRVARIAAALAAFAGAGWMFGAGPQVWPGVLGLLACAWLMGHIAGHRIPVGRALTHVSVVLPIMAIALPFGALAALGPTPHDGLWWPAGLVHGVLGLWGWRFAHRVSGRASDRELARSCIGAAFVAMVAAILFLGSFASSCPPALEEAATSWAARDFAVVPAFFVLGTGVPQVPLFWWLFARRVRRERLAVGGGELAVDTGAGEPTPPVRRVYVARCGRIAASRALLACLALAIAHSLAVYLGGEHPRDILPGWALIGLVTTGVVYALARAFAFQRFERLTMGGQDSGVRLARGKEYASVSLPLAAGMLVLPSLACALAAAVLVSDLRLLEVNPGKFLHLSLLGFFPAHVFIVLLALRFGLDVQTRPSGELARFPWMRSLGTVVTAVFATWIWGLALVPHYGAEVLAIVGLGGLLCVPTAYGIMVAILRRERRVLDDVSG
jgi:hypothetical protein